MKLSTARIMLEAAHPDMKAAVIVPVHDVLGGFQLCFGVSDNNIVHTLESQRGRRVFKSIDAANKAAQDIGYKYVSIYNPMP